jgi:hypothetical protein
VEDGTRVRWARFNSLIVIVKGGHSCWLHGSCVSCCQVNTLQGYIILIRISATPLYMGEACSLCSNVEVLYRHVHMGFMVRLNYDYLVVENDDTKNGSVTVSSHPRPSSPSAVDLPSFPMVLSCYRTSSPSSPATGTPPPPQNAIELPPLPPSIINPPLP